MRIAYLPGVATASEAMAAAEAGFDTLKFFPAQAAGSVALLKGLALRDADWDGITARAAGALATARESIA